MTDQNSKGCSVSTGGDCAVLLIGKTGSGKSTLINYLANYFRGGSLDKTLVAVPDKHHKRTEDERDTEIDHENQTTSKTTECTSYKFAKDGVRFQFIDTPGLGGLHVDKTDEENMDYIVRAARNKHYPSAVVLVISANNAKPSSVIRNTISKLSEIMSDPENEKLVGVVTGCGKERKDLDYRSLFPLMVKREYMFAMDNCAFDRSSTEWKRGQLNTTAWNDSMDEIRKMLIRLCNITTGFTPREVPEPSETISEDIPEEEKYLKGVCFNYNRNKACGTEECGVKTADSRFLRLCGWCTGDHQALFCPVPKVQRKEVLQRFRSLENDIAKKPFTKGCCHSWNRGTCKPAPCPSGFRHVCGSCGGDHRVMVCHLLPKN